MARTKGWLRRRAHLAFKEVERERAARKSVEANLAATYGELIDAQQEAARLKDLKEPRLVLFGWRI